ncbi:G2/mitotic-specific cyclin-B3-like [Dysidea avara]|uniref:G2/mitotic-specific cyclin-B3-like n=1 Tax=Dysidea avara TaxID=196820 RepID=UPI0033288008
MGKTKRHSGQLSAPSEPSWKNFGKAKKVQAEAGQVGKKRESTSPRELPNAKRAALGNITNVTVEVERLAAKQVLAKKGIAVKPGVPAIKEECSIGVTPIQTSLQATSIQDESGDLKLEDSAMSTDDQSWNDIDKAESQDHLFSADYAPEIFQYMREREEQMLTMPYIHKGSDISEQMRTILVDWLIEVQENFALFHETLYLAVQIMDHYLERKSVKREYLQLVGATSMLIASKFEEISPPLVDDFIYLCDDAYKHDEMLQWERDILKTLNYDINYPVAYRFLRRLAKAANINLETHTLARYICESTLQEYQFIGVRPSQIAAGAMYLTIRMRKLGNWTSTLRHYSGMDMEEILPLAHRLNSMLKAPLGQTCTVRNKYSHEAFFKVASIPPLEDVYTNATTIL